MTFTDGDGDEEERVNYVECRDLVAGEAILTILLIAARDDYEEAAEAAQPVLDSIDLAGRAGEDADDDDGDDEDEDRPGRDEERFVSEKYGFAIAWAAPWEARLQVVSGDPDGVDQLVLTNETSTVVFSGVTGYDGDATECLEAMEKVIRDDPDNDDVEPGEDEDGDPIREEEDDRAYALFVFDRDRGGTVPAPPGSPGSFSGPRGERAHYVECRTLMPGETVLVIGHDAPLGDYEDEAEERDELLEGAGDRPVRRWFGDLR